MDTIVDDEAAYVEEMIGISLVALQTQIRRIVKTSKEFGIEAMDIGAEFSRTGKALIRLIWDAANYYKHRDEWTAEVWEDSGRSDRWLEQARRTWRNVQASSDHPQEIFAPPTISSASQPYSNWRHLAEQVQLWAEAAYMGSVPTKSKH